MKSVVAASLTAGAFALDSNATAPSCSGDNDLIKPKPGCYSASYGSTYKGTVSVVLEEVNGDEGVITFKGEGGFGLVGLIWDCESIPYVRKGTRFLTEFDTVKCDEILLEDTIELEYCPNQDAFRFYEKGDFGSHSTFIPKVACAVEQATSQQNDVRRRSTTQQNDVRRRSTTNQNDVRRRSTTQQNDVRRRSTTQQNDVRRRSTTQQNDVRRRSTTQQNDVRRRSTTQQLSQPSHVDPLPGWDFICNGYVPGNLPGREGLGPASPQWLGEVGCMRACENQGRCDFVTYDHFNGNCWMEIIPDRPTECDSNTGGWAYWRNSQDDQPTHVDPLPGWDFICNGYVPGNLPGREGLGPASPQWLGEVGCMRACENQGRCDFVTYDHFNGNCWMEIIPDRPTECDSNTGGWAYWRNSQDVVV